MNRPVMLDQVLHGYDRGHRLIAASKLIDVESLKLIDRLSDAAGQQESNENEGYLTGYPLPDGSYALGRTWPALEANRPNSVWTHTLIIPPEALLERDLFALARYLDKRPSSEVDLAQYERRIDHAILVGKASRPLLDMELRKAGALVYFTRETPVWVVEADLEARNMLALALWSQQWPRLRRRFAFCTGALDKRRLDKRPFDLLMRASSGDLRFTASIHAMDPNALDAWEALADDLGNPGQLREFLRKCGPDTSKISSVVAFTDVWLTAKKKPHEPLLTIDRLVAAGPKASQFRRLKRATLRGEDALLSNSDPCSVIGSFNGSGVANAILAEDAFLPAWLERAWDELPESLAAALVAPRKISNQSASTGTIADELSPMAAEVILKRALVRDLSWISIASASLAVRIVRERNDPAWWEAFAALPLQQFSALTKIGCGAESKNEARQIVRAVAHQPDNRQRWEFVEFSAQPFLLSAALQFVGTHPDPPFGLLEVIHSLQESFAPVLGANSSVEELAGAASLIDSVNVIDEIDITQWLRLYRARSLWWDDSQRASVLFVASLRSSNHGDEADAMLRDAYENLYSLLSSAKEPEGWPLLASNLHGSSQSWDRCKRLAQTTVRAALSEKYPRGGVLKGVTQGPAAVALLDAAEDMLNPKKDPARAIVDILRSLRP